MRIYSARDYLAAFEPWLLEDVSALPGILEEDTRSAEQAAYRLLIPVNSDGKYPVEVWVMVHPIVNKRAPPQLPCRRDKTQFGFNSH